MKKVSSWWKQKLGMIVMCESGKKMLNVAHVYGMKQMLGETILRAERASCDTGKALCSCTSR